jgi:hypothetical protein
VYRSPALGDGSRAQTQAPAALPLHKRIEIRCCVQSPALGDCSRAQTQAPAALPLHKRID